MTSEPRSAPATARNREPIIMVLRQVLPDAGMLLEIASGTGEHAAFMAPYLPGWTWQPSDAEPSALADIDAHARMSGCDRILPAVALDVRANPWPVTQADALFCCNMIHIAPWDAAEGLFAGAARILSSDAPLILYGPFKRYGAHSAPSNEAFDADLKGRNASWGVRCLDTEVTPLVRSLGFSRDAVVAMPANNLTVVFRR